MGEEEVGIEFFGNPLMLGELLAVVGRQRVNAGRKKASTLCPRLCNMEGHRHLHSYISDSKFRKLEAGSIFPAQHRWSHINAPAHTTNTKPAPIRYPSVSQPA